MLALHMCVMSSFLVHEMGKVPLAGAVVRMTQDKVGLAPSRSEHPGATGEHPGAQVELGAPAHHAFSSSRTPPQLSPIDPHLWNSAWTSGRG